MGTFLKLGSPFLYDEDTKDIVGIGDPDGSYTPILTPDEVVAMRRSRVATRTVPSVYSTRDIVFFGGDSITNGSSATNAGTLSFKVIAQQMLGSARVKGIVNGGVAGNWSKDLLARLNAGAAVGSTVAFTMIGTNDAGNSVPLSQYASNVQAIADAYLASGVRVLAFGTVPPTGSAASNNQTYIDQYNVWLRMFCLQNGFYLVETHALLVDPATGYLSATYDSGDGTHPNNAGHFAIGQLVYATLDKMVCPSILGIVDGVSNGYGLVANPVATNGTTGMSVLLNYHAYITLATTDPVSSDTVGAWFTASGTAVTESSYTVYGVSIDTSAVNTGDILLFTAKTKDSGTTNTMGTVELRTGVTQIATLKVTSSGISGDEHALVYTYNGESNLRITWGVGWSSGDTFSASVTKLQAYNLTKMGLDALIT